MRGHTRSLTLRPEQDHLVATASPQCGFVAMQGDGRDRVQRVPLRGDDAVLVLDDPRVLTVDRDRTAGLLDPQDRFCCPTLLTGDSLAYLTLRRHDDSAWQFGAHGFGPAGTSWPAT